MFGGVEGDGGCFFARGGLIGTLGEVQELVRFEVGEGLRFRTGPVDDDFFEGGIFSEAEVEPTTGL